MNNHRLFSLNLYKRHASSQASLSKSFSKTLNLPKTEFPQRADAVKRESLFRKRTTTDLYEWLQKTDRKPFILHDGPPYANGKLHLGHALNKIPKDIINRYKILKGYRAIYIPGWDCHGLPIELKALAGKNKVKSPLDIRKEARALAQKCTQEQSVEFQSYGILGDWDHPYLTHNLNYEINQLRVFAKMVDRGLIYRRHKPVYWSPSSRTALAEAELEYKEDHKSNSVYVSLPLIQPSSALEEILRQNNVVASKCSLAIWTTTPWTLPANRAVAVHQDISYALVENSLGKYWIVGLDRVDVLRDPTAEIKVLTTFDGRHLINSTYMNPLYSDIVMPVLHANFVTADSGTGLVHCAPGHGHDDYELCLQHGIDAYAPVDDGGAFTDLVGIPELTGLKVLKEGNLTVIDILRESGYLIQESLHIHKYPYDWRTKKPIIIRATKQWFADLSKVKSAAEAAIEEIEMIPTSSRNRLRSFIQGRSEWCISRQRSWGVPIPVLYDVQTHEPLLTNESIEHIVSLLSERGMDAWWSDDVRDFIPPPYRDGEFYKGTDTMDVWFDSGTSWATLQNRLDNFSNPIADVYLEGSDQHRGWFQSSVLTAVATTGKVPTKTIITHGFILDEKGQKMSKSLGNVTEPKMVIFGDSKRLNLYPPNGVDVLRLWAASTDYTHDVSIGPTILKHVAESMRKMRNTARFMLGNLRGSIHEVEYASLSVFEKYMLHQLHEFATSCERYYEEYAFNKVVQTINKFTTVTLSSFMFDVIKDTLYADRENDVVSTLSILREILCTYTSVIAPIVPHLSEEIHEFGRSLWVKNNKDHFSVFQQGWHAPLHEWKNPEIVEQMQPLLELSDAIKRLLEKTRADKKIGSSLEADVCIDSEVNLSSEKVNLLKKLSIVSNIHLSTKLEPELMTSFCYTDMVDIGGHAYNLSIINAQKHKCPRCWIYQSEVQDSLCSRCEVAVNTLQEDQKV